MDNKFAERLCYKGKNVPGQFELEELEQLHKFLIKEIASHFGPPAAVQVLGKALLSLKFEDSSSPMASSSAVPQLAIEGERESPFQSLQGRWKKAHEMLVEYPDLWVARGVHKQPLLRAIRRRWNPRVNEWNPDEDVMVKMDDTPFGAGAMRECYAMKKLSSHTTHRDWKRALNLVAKRYKNPSTSAEVYYEDVKLQMDAKLLGELYNSCHPPKKVDFITAQLYELLTGPMKGLYCVESLIEGEYIKHNSNSGFVEDEEQRNTPQAFSHWTYQYTRGEKILVDVQGVGDLYTDPQIHTRDGKGYGNGNLGPRGMALFFRAHECNAICHKLGLSPFPRCQADVKCVMSRSNSRSMTSQRSFGDHTVSNAFKDLSENDLKDLEQKVAAMNSVQADVAKMLSKAWQKEQADCAAAEPSQQAYVHFELAKLHGEAVLLPELHEGLSVDDSTQGGLFHLFQAAFEGSALACCVLARVYSGLSPSINQIKALIEQANVADGFDMVEDPELALMYVKLAAGKGVRNAALYLANEMSSGENCNAGTALSYFKLSLEEKTCPPEVEEEAAALPGANLPQYAVYAAIANLYANGGEGMERDLASAAEHYGMAAEAATEVGKGKAAAKYYELQAAAESE
mmetsp:Transcript_2601/g.7375  ORF Transcript_2601/g.7375 Transcript_2601/m.7375 type:complete len:628 (+) Transcript_2601:74-1957(+)